MSAIPRDSQERNFIDNFCSKKLSSKELLQFNPEKINRSARAALGLRGDLTQSELNLLYRNVTDLGKTTELTPAQEEIYRTNLAALRRLIKPESELEGYNAKSRWSEAGWLEKDRETFQNEIEPMEVVLDKKRNPEGHISTYRGEKGNQFLNDLMRNDIRRGHSVLIRKNKKDFPGERFPAKAPQDRFSQEDLESGAAGQTLEKEFLDRIKKPPFSSENEKIIAKLCITQNFLHPAMQIYLESYLPKLQELFPLYRDANYWLTREGVAGEEIETILSACKLKEGEQSPVILDFEKKASFCSEVLEYKTIDIGNGHVAMYLQADIMMDWKTGDVTVYRMRPLAIRNFKTEKMEVFQRPNIPFRSDDWPFPPSS